MYGLLGASFGFYWIYTCEENVFNSVKYDLYRSLKEGYELVFF